MQVTSADAAGLDEVTYGRHETREHVPSRVYRQVWCQVFEVDDIAELGLGTSPKAEAHWTWATDAERRAEVDRRAALRFGIAIAGRALLPASLHEQLAHVLARSQRLDLTLLTRLQTFSADLAGSYATTRPEELLPPAREHLRTVVRLLDTSLTPDRRGQLLWLAGDAAILCGWLSFYADRMDAADGYLHDASGLACEAEDRTLQAQVLGSRSILSATTATGGQHGNTALALAQLTEAAHLGRSAPPVTQCWLAARLAEEHATAGDEVAFERHMEQARTALDQASRQSSGIGFLATFLAGWDEANLQGFDGIGYLLLARPQDATVALTRTLQQARSGKDRTLPLVDLSVALAMQAEPEQAASAAVEALNLALEAGDLMAVRRVRSAAARLEPWRHLPAVRDLDERLRSAA